MTCTERYPRIASILSIGMASPRPHRRVHAQGTLSADRRVRVGASHLGDSSVTPKESEKRRTDRHGVGLEGPWSAGDETKRVARPRLTSATTRSVTICCSMGRRGLRRLWAFVDQASTIAWLWSIGGGAVASVVLRQVTSLPVAWLVVFGIGAGCLILASIATLVPLGRSKIEAAAPAPPGSGFDPSKWAVTFGGFLVRSDYDAGHDIDAEAKRALLWLRPPEQDPIDPNLCCQVKTPTGDTFRSPTVGQVGGPAAPGTRERNRVPNADYLIEYPTAFARSAPWSDGLYEVMWLSGNTSIRGDHFEMRNGKPTA